VPVAPAKQKKYIVLGSTGQLGHDLCPRLPGQVVGLTRADIDLTRTDAVRGMLDRLRPDAVINCAAYNYVDRAESELSAAFQVNAYAVRELALACRDLGCTLVHFSTDYVYGLDAGRLEPYLESDRPGPVNVYGVSKLSGEFLVRANCPRHFIIRTCGLYGVWGSGGKGGNFVETMLRLAGEGKLLRVVDDQVCTPSYTVDIADAVACLVQTEHYGLYHVTNAGSCSWYQFAGEIIGQAGMKKDITPITSEEFGAAARRPSFSVLSNMAYETLGFTPLRPWQEALAAYLRERRPVRS